MDKKSFERTAVISIGTGLGVFTLYESTTKGNYGKCKKTARSLILYTFFMSALSNLVVEKYLRD